MSSSEWDDEFVAAKPKVTKKAAVVAAIEATKKPRVTKKKAALAEANTDHGFPDTPEFSKPLGTGKTVEEIYQKKTQLEHILIRPDTYIGSIESQTQKMWVYENDRMVWRDVTFVPGLYKIFDEIIVNAADNKVRDPSMDTIRVNIDRENNVVSVYNNGSGIPIEMHAKEGVYVPELIFGHLLTSSNYDDNEKKITGGRNGYGAKLCNIFSTEFTVETADSKSGRKFVQTHFDNMSRKSTPKITNNAKGEEYTKITFKPDLKRFGMTSIDDDFEALAKKRAYDMAGCIRGVKVYLNDVRIKVKDFKDYAEMYVNSGSSTGLVGKPTIIYERPNERWEVAFTLSDGQFQQVSFVNSICTMKGGTHVNHVADQLVNNLIEAVKKKDKKGVPLKPFQAKNHLWIFVNCYIENPAFDSQTKENMTLRQSSFGSKCAISDDFIKKVVKSGVVDNILSFAKFKQDQLLKKTDGTKRARITGLAKLDDANNAGTRNAHKCTLILTEGDSAKALAISGLSVVGRDNFGVFPLRGKLLNVREASHTQITNNAEINAIKQILGLQHGKVYKSTEGLRYGHLMIMTDQDHDGSHIKGLIINLLDHFWPSLLAVPGFLLEFITPIVKVTKGTNSNKREVSFFTIPEYEAWKEANEDGKGWTIKYYKGLGTSTTDDAKKYFSAMDRHLKSFAPADEGERRLIDMAFSKKKADDRKEWLRQFEPGTYMDHDQESIPISDFINKELILFSMADNARSIPSAVDGLKPGQRKIIFSCFKRNLKAELKVAQLAGYVSEHSAYHHGEQSLATTIVGLAQNYVGSNNLPLLEPRGQFGTRLQGGKDAASPRYIYTVLSPLTRALFHPADDALLNYQNEDGQNIEPQWYLPILPTLLLNGSEGIGTGWSSSIPNYNPRDIVDNLYRLMKGEEPLPMHPWYRGFNGSIEQIGQDKYRVSGCISKIDDTTVEITELPIRTWTQNYKEDLESWLTGTEKQASWIKEYREYHTHSNVHFHVTLSEEQMALAEQEGLEKRFKLVSTISTSNLVCFDREGRIKRYESIDEILREFYELRLGHYYKRKQFLLDQLTHDLAKLDNKVRFVTEIIKGELVVQNKKRDVLFRELKQRKYLPVHAKKDKLGDAEAEDESDADPTDTKSHGYDYLLSMPIWNLTWEKVQKLLNEKQIKEAEVSALSSQSVFDLWRTDLEAFLVQWDSYESALEVSEAQRPANSTTASNRKKASAPKVSAKPRVVKTPVVSLSSDEEIQPQNDAVKAAPIKPVAKRRTVKPKATELAPKDEPEDMMIFSAPPKSVASKPKRVIRKATAAAPEVEDVAATMSTLSLGDTDAVKKRSLGAKKAAAPGKTRTAVAKSNTTEPIVIDSFAFDDDDESKTVVSNRKPAAKPRAATKAIKTKRSVDDWDAQSDEHVENEMDVDGLVTAAPAKSRQKRVVNTKATSAKTRRAIVISSSEDESAPPAASSGPTRTTRGRKPVSYALGFESEDSAGGDSDGFQANMTVDDEDYE